MLPYGCGCIQWLRDFLAAHFPELKRDRLRLCPGQVCAKKAYVLKLFQYPEGRKAPIKILINVFIISLNIGVCSKSHFYQFQKNCRSGESRYIIILPLPSRIMAGRQKAVSCLFWVSLVTYAPSPTISFSPSCLPELGPPLGRGHSAPSICRGPHI